MPVDNKASAAYRWNLEQYTRLTEIDAFDDARVELLDGEIWSLGRQSPRHATAVQMTRKVLREVFGIGFIVSTKMPVTLTDTSGPEPDLSVAPGVPNHYADHHPGPSEIMLLVEVSEDTLVKDRRIKRTIYAAAGIKDYWIIDLIKQQVEVYRQPTPTGTYTDCKVHLPGGTITPLKLPGKTVAVSDLLPPAPKQNL